MFRFGAPAGLHLAQHWGRRMGLRIETMLHHRFHGHGARDFAVGFSPHAIRQHVEVQRLHNLEAIFVVRSNATKVGHAATHNFHTCSDSLPLPFPLA